MFYFSFDPSHNLLYCENYKIASSTWATHLLKMNKMTIPEGRIHLAASKMFSLRGAMNITSFRGAMNLNKLNNITSFLIVRDPFERILSAYTVNNILEDVNFGFCSIG